MKIGDKVKWQTNGKEKDGTIHGIRKADLGKGEVVIGYLIDTGKVLHKQESINAEGEKEVFIQPELADIEASQVSLA